MKWQGIFVYGNPIFQKRRKLWQELTVSNRNKEEPQAVLGDFNDILSQDEKVGLHPQPKIYLDTFRKFVDDNGLIDIDLKGSRFTWYSNPRNNFVTRERLDRVLVNWKWLSLHQNVVLKAAPAISSDHCALILETQPKVRMKKEFRYEAFWTEHEECEEVIRRSWQQDDRNRNCWNQFIKKRGRCIRELTEWSKRKFKRADKEIEKRKKEKVSELIREGEGWDLDKIQKFFHGNEIELITRTPISLVNKKDHLVWPYRNDGEYSVKSGYQAAKEEKDTMEKLAGGEQDKILCKLGCVCWCIWKARNQHIFQQKKLNPQNTIIHSEQITTEYHNATKDLNKDIKAMADRNGEKRRITWRPPPRNKIKVNIDAAFQRETGIATTAAVFRDWEGKIITGASSKFKSISALAAEAQAYREALILTKNLQIRNCIIESDCLPLVQAIKARSPLAEADAIIRDILQLLEEAPDVGATWTPREGNTLAHQLAAMAAVNQLQRQWTFNPPIQIMNIIRTEAGFAILQNNQRNRIQDNQVSSSTNPQGNQRDEGLPGRVERETWNSHATQGNRRIHNPVSTRQTKPTSRDTFNNTNSRNKWNEDSFHIGQMLSQHKCSNGHNVVENSTNLGRAQRQQGELQRGGELAPDEDGTHTMIGERIEAGDITLDGPQQYRNFHKEPL
ncbi:hypothetical protein Ahy_A08g040636 [Arachis hypogaea]|uniref:RNase H type-1 domain-containing protein n=1 Tax=Arachis hypogaea TaxID=3818 RepID=A0A445C077_ARAHY|nr:hypothetical protein Ahy_A08g040636 [Arachis hypogaea]